MARDNDPEFEDDDEALRWAGDEDRGRAAPRLAGQPSEPGGDEPTADDAEPVAPRRSDRLRLVGTGLFAGLFLAYTVGWIIAVQLITSGAADLFGEIMWQFGEFLAIVSAALWFAGTVYLTRDSRTRTRLGWLAVGAVLVVPWPILWGFLL